MREEWRGFEGTRWVQEVNVRDFIHNIRFTQQSGHPRMGVRIFLFLCTQHCTDALIIFVL